MSQAENNKSLKGVSIVFITEFMLEFNVIRINSFILKFTKMQYVCFLGFQISVCDIIGY